MDRLIRGGVAVALGLALAVPANGAVTEILVTAQRREAALQTVPIAVSAFDVQQIRDLQIDMVKDIGENIPNLQTYTVTAGAQALQVHSRGTSVQNPGFNLSESPVGIYVDDVYYGRLASANLDLADIERIEVLRGPQGTLYGRNTIAGAVKIITRTPGDETWGDLSLGLGNYQTTRITASVGGPLETGALAGSIAVLWDQRNGGWQPNEVSGRDAGQYENMGARAKLHWYGTSNFSAILTGWAFDLENDGYNGVPQVPFANTEPLPGYGGLTFQPAPAGSQPLGDFYGNFNEPGANYGESDQAGVNLDLRFEFGEVTLRSITGYANIKDQFGFDLAGGGFLGIPGLAGLLITSDSKLDQISQEFQLLGTAMGDRLKWLGGVFYLNEDGRQLFSGDIFGSGFQEDIRSETDSYAIFAEGTYQLTDAFSVTAGLRWTRDEKEYTNDCVGLFCQSEEDPFGSFAANVALKDDWSEFTGRLGFDYQLNDASLVYLSWAQGYQSGGFRTLCFGNLTEVCGGSTFKPQTVDSFELGYKGDLFDRTLRFNAALFYAMYSDIQSIVLPSGGTGTSFPINNIGDVDVYGVELEITWVPIDRLNIFAIFGFQESDFGTVDPASPPGGLSGNAPPTRELASNPSWQGKAGFNYTVPLARSLQFRYGLDVVHSDDYFSESRNLVRIDSYTRLNGFLSVGDQDDRWQVALTAKNLTDEEDYISGIFAQDFTNIRTAAPPAEYMVTFKISY